MEKNLKKNIYHFAIHLKLAQHCKLTLLHLKNGFKKMYLLFIFTKLSLILLRGLYLKLKAWYIMELFGLLHNI